MSESQMGHIGIIDHDALVREGLKDCMESAGYSVETLGSAEEFLASNSSLRASYLIVDIQLPGMSGLELQRRLSILQDRVPPSFSLRRTELTQPVNRHSGTEQRRFYRNPSVAKNC